MVAVNFLQCKSGAASVVLLSGNFPGASVPMNKPHRPSRTVGNAGHMVWIPAPSAATADWLQDHDHIPHLDVMIPNLTTDFPPPKTSTQPSFWIQRDVLPGTCQGSVINIPRNICLLQKQVHSKAKCTSKMAD